MLSQFMEQYDLIVIKLTVITKSIIINQQIRSQSHMTQKSANCDKRNIVVPCSLALLKGFNSDLCTIAGPVVSVRSNTYF